MKGMIDGRLLKRGWDRNELGQLLLGETPYDYETDADESAFFLRLRQVSDFLRCRTPAERARVVPSMIAVLEASRNGPAQAGAILLRRAFAASSSGRAPHDDLPSSGEVDQ